MQPLWAFGWCYNLSVPLCNQVVYCLCLQVPKLFTVYALGTKAFVLITLPRAVDRETLSILVLSEDLLICQIKVSTFIFNFDPDL